MSSIQKLGKMQDIRQIRPAVGEEVTFCLMDSKMERKRLHGTPPLISYTAWYEKIVSFALYLGSKDYLYRLSVGIAFASIIIPLIVLLLRGHTHATVHVWLPVVCALLLVGVLLYVFIFREQRWETLGVDVVVNNEFYEPVTGAVDDSSYKPRQIEDIYYSQGVWKTTTGDHCLKFRGVNLPAKNPTYGHDPTMFFSEKKNVSFVGTPFPLETAHEHFQRLSNYGFNLLRLTVTWEAVMHQAPGIIDQEYLNYLSKLVDIAAEFGLYIIIDPHQDVWSRFTGGDGAPWWTLDAAGFVTDEKLHTTGAAFIDHLQDPNDPPAKMVWPTNYGKVATATMFTLFFAGDTYAPNINVDESYAINGKRVSMQKFLQTYYLQFIDIVAKTVKDKPNVIGFNTMNEPSNGYACIKDLRVRTFPAPIGQSLSYFDGMRVGRGESLQCQYYPSAFRFHSNKVLNSDELSVWKTPDHDIWRKLQVYDVDEDTGNTILRQPNYFASKEGQPFIEQHMVPLFEKIASTIRQHNKKFITYAEPFIDVNNHEMYDAPIYLDADTFAWGPHWYDGAALLFRKYIEWFALDDENSIPIVSRMWIASTFKRILGHLSQTGNGLLHVVLGECGVPFDTDDANNYEASTRALERTMRAIEANNLDFTLWNYFPSNTREDGDQWNGEDLSVRSDNKNRALLSLIRPFVYEISPGFDIVEQKFDPTKRAKKYELKLRRNEVCVTSQLIYIYLPHFHFNAPLPTVSCGTCQHYDSNSQLLVWDCSDTALSNGQQLELMLRVENAH